VVSESGAGSGNRNPVTRPARIISETKFSQEENEIGSRIENLASNEKSMASREHQSSPLKTSHKPRTKTRSSTTTKAKRTAQVKCENRFFHRNPTRFIQPLRSPPSSSVWSDGVISGAGFMVSQSFFARGNWLYLGFGAVINDTWYSGY
jgi:hypothetical protein